MRTTAILAVSAVLVLGCGGGEAGTDGDDAAVPADASAPPPRDAAVAPVDLRVPPPADATMSPGNPDLAAAAAGCGANPACGDGGVCEADAGACVECTADAHCRGGRSCCGLRCLDTGADPANCGACGVKCPAPNNTTATCDQGRCAARCAPGFSDCNQDPRDGCEVAVGADTRNCGQCGRACAVAHAAAVCVGGTCGIGSCDPGFRNCNGNAGDGCETDIAADVKNCGACGSDCQALPHATAGCAAGVCAIGACAGGWGDCDRMPGNGCESELAADPANCGGCGKACPAPPHVMTTCTAGVCGTGGCQSRFADCNKNMNDGCEVGLDGDRANCGACGNACPAVPNGTGACAAGVCGANCNAGFADCDKVLANGCEKDLNNDASNCGGCGKACPNGQRCAGGICQSARACGEADEGFTATITCPNGTTVGTVDFASYGTPTGACGAYQIDGNCHAMGSIQIVQGLCLGKASCTVASDNNVFGDPCFGTYKHLYIQVGCQ